MITFFEVWQDRFGFKNTTQIKIDPTVFAMVVTLSAAGAKDEAVGLIEDLILSDKRRRNAPLSMDYTFAISGKKILNALNRKGWWADEWDEGSHGVACEGFEQACREKIRAIEARVDARGWGW